MSLQIIEGGNLVVRTYDQIISEALESNDLVSIEKAINYVNSNIEENDRHVDKIYKHKTKALKTMPNDSILLDYDRRIEMVKTSKEKYENDLKSLVEKKKLLENSIE